MIRALCGGPGRPLRERHRFPARARQRGHGTATDRCWVIPVRIAACCDLRRVGVRSPSAGGNYLSPERVARTATTRPAAYIGDKTHYAGDSPRLSAYRTRGGRLHPYVAWFAEACEQPADTPAFVAAPGRARSRERHSHAEGAAQARSQGWSPLNPGTAAGPARIPRKSKSLGDAARGSQIRSRESQYRPHALPDLTEQNVRRPFRAPAR